MTEKNQPITGDTVITGAEFRDFYKNHWPKEWCVDEMPLEVEDERGNYVLPDDAMHPLSWFGVPSWQGPNDQGYEWGETREMHDLYAEVTGKLPQEATASFKVHPDKLDELVAMAEKLGARRI